MYILVVEDEADLRMTLELNLQREGYEIKTAADGQSALSILSQFPKPDLVLLDIMLPDLSGTEICRRIRENKDSSHISVILLTAKAEEDDRIKGFQTGADDYVVKPFSIRELILRIRAVLKRANKAKTQNENSELSFGILKIDTSAHRTWVNTSEVKLTALEFKLLQTFLDRKGRTQTRERLLTDVWDICADVTTRTVDTHIKRLRAKLMDAGEYIETVRGIGYRFKNELNGA